MGISNTLLRVGNNFFFRDHTEYQTGPVLTYSVERDFCGKSQAFWIFIFQVLQENIFVNLRLYSWE